jgi:hypothetical protein
MSQARRGLRSADPNGRRVYGTRVYCCRPMNGDEFEGKAAESLKNETLRLYLACIYLLLFFCESAKR